MSWLHLVVHALGGLILANSIPHLVNGLSGRPLQSPFARPPGIGYSSSTVNVLWGWLNLALAYVLLVRVGSFDLHDTTQVLVTALPAIGFSAYLAHHFGAVNGGNHPLALQRETEAANAARQSPPPAKQG